MRMRLTVAVLVMAVSVSAAPQPGLWDSIVDAAKSVGQRGRDAADFAKGAAQGTGDMIKAYRDMKEANWRDSDKYFHSRGNADAASRGPGGKWAAEVISDTRELTDRLRGGTAADSARDQAANEWGRNGGDPNRYRPQGLPGQY
ncbi:serum amyloid A-5 protein-like [Homarus americanus]|uniref:Serum amyloid A-3 protein-like 2 n=1 Tax=Homarus americanus TaxID=6706 RepID=A0A8J5N616_HOMAM|nr:serum amyloid A-5 protein-like [Homarus americanus]KAG7173938.1 Serum amyloid A-3 protein-like 2 [Homarus americanus]